MLCSCWRSQTKRHPCTATHPQSRISGSMPILLTTRYRFDMSSVGLLSFSFFTRTWCLYKHLFLNVQHHIFWIQHLQVVCIPCLYNVCSRPTTIFYTTLKRTINFLSFVTHRTMAEEGGPELQQIGMHSALPLLAYTFPLRFILIVTFIFVWSYFYFINHCHW